MEKEYYPRQRLIDEPRSYGPISIVSVHPLAVVESVIGDKTRVWAWAHIMEGAEVGKNCNIGEHVFIEKGAAVGDNCILKNGVCVWENIILENNVFIASGVVFTNEKYTRSGYRREHLVTRIRKGATIGAGSVILPGLEIGEYATIGAGSVVTKSVRPYALVYGNPTEQHGWVCKCGVVLLINDLEKPYKAKGEYASFYICPECQKQYETIFDKMVCLLDDPDIILVERKL